jgi:hypothetical protein
MEAVRVDKPHCQSACWDLALAKKSFEVIGFNDRHQPFGDYLSSSFGYSVKRGVKRAVFIPPASKAASAGLSRASADPHHHARPRAARL